MEIKYDVIKGTWVIEISETEKVEALRREDLIRWIQIQEAEKVGAYYGEIKNE